ncbi:hypothetical protein K3757_17950 [Sulfitobacter sp. S223]|uniref:hypothetical protein n=1 Tax=Sulfitobacter sp. S223 TaxID=2867023 RepID=UPI0021A5A39A|nr:hypothetical protein [Sulfitobacter sp. S223]UWR26301.1 hypothetical protein K3757_17950 [Sulfitobacter sp. S223]
MTREVVDFTKLDALLEQERALLLEGDLEGLGTLLPLKEKMVDLLLSDETSNRAKIKPLEGKLHRNQLLLDGALEGIQTVANRLAALREVRSSLETYDALGRKNSVPTPTAPKVEKRA